MEIHLHIIGVILILLALTHVIFPKYFRWKKEFANVSNINKEMMYVHTFFIALFVLLNGVLNLTSAEYITQTVLGKRIALGLAIFWGCRLIIQFTAYSSANWKGKKFETMIHILFSLFWIYITCIYFLIYYNEYLVQSK